MYQIMLKYVRTHDSRVRDLLLSSINRERQRIAEADTTHI